MVATNYRNNLNDIDPKIFVNSLSGWEPDTATDETTIKIETDRFDSCGSNYEAVYIPSTNYWDDLTNHNDGKIRR